MKYQRILRNICVALALLSCVSPNESERQAVSELSRRFPEYKFKPLERHVIGNYLKVILKRHNVDTLQLKQVYYAAMDLKKDVNGEQKFVWSHLVVYDEMNEYLFTMLLSGDSVKFMKDDIF